MQAARQDARQEARRATGSHPALTAPAAAAGTRHAGDQPTRGAPHVLVCVTARASDAAAVRGGRALADQLGGRLSVVYAFAPGDAPKRRDALWRTRAVAASAGVPLIEVPAYSAADGVVEFAAARGVTHIVMTEEPSGRALFMGRSRLETQLVTRLDGVDLLIITSWRPRPELGRSDA